MKLIIEKFAKIEKADIEVDGITVIAGENNTGKSTVGKILFSLFNCISGLEDKIVEQRIEEIRRTCRFFTKSCMEHKIRECNSPWCGQRLAENCRKN